MMVKGLRLLTSLHFSPRLKQLRAISTNSKFEIRENLSTTNNDIGSYSEIQHSFSQSDVQAFADLCGDNNPLHVNPQFAAQSRFKGTIVHGILLSSLFSTLLGRTIPGSIYVKQNLQFKSPVRVNELIVARIEVVTANRRSSGTFLTCSTRCMLANQSMKVAVDGEATVLVPNIPPI